jgi:hypothetical protein
MRWPLPLALSCAAALCVSACAPREHEAPAPSASATVSSAAPSASVAAPAKPDPRALLGLENGPDAPDGPRVGSRFVKKTHSVSLGTPVIKGRLLPAVATSIVEAKYKELHTCYRERLPANPTLAGDLSVTLTIDARGRVAETSTSGSITDAPLLACLTTNVFSLLTFPTSAGTPLQVTYPLQLAIGTTVSGKSIFGITADDMRAALLAAQCTDVTNEGPAYTDGPILFTCTQKNTAVAVAFVPVRGKSLPEKTLARLAEKGALYHEGSPFAVAIAIEGDADKSRAAALLGAIVTDPR